MSRKILRCALYTRKSSDEGLDQEFNSLDAQREACEAYVKSQAAEGWKALHTHYDDGGFSGGSMERPGLKALLADIEAGKIDVIVVYKIDRLTRSLADFARMVELFDKHEVSFVSVTQSFNTTSSMGRLTLNVLLSFAQFEREVTGERIRDKIAASKAKGMWMGGTLPLGYDLPNDKSRTLVVNEAEAETVRLIFTQYLKIGAVHKLEKWLEEHDIRSKQRTTAAGKVVGGIVFGRSALYHLLRNHTYLGLIRHKDVLHPGNHPGIIDRKLFDKVQAKLDDGVRRSAERRNLVERGPLSGRIFDAEGRPMSPTYSKGKKGVHYRYYVSTTLQQGKDKKADKDSTLIERVPAKTLENQLSILLERIAPNAPGEVLDRPKRIDIHRDAVHIVLKRDMCAGIQGRLTEHEVLVDDAEDPSHLRVIASIRIRNRRGTTEVVQGKGPKINRDPVLIGALQRAHAMIEFDSNRLPRCINVPHTQYGRRLIRLALLAPDLQKMILAGRQPVGLNLDQLMSPPLPADWTEQRKLFA
ncbi:MAG: recombinase family protein [Novosphingobium sp.]|nr:recombinase family protein [Novosphingobium sp.]MBO9604009.1 recombinase family protein [Novosphingobium sp.]